MKKAGALPRLFRFERCASRSAPQLQRRSCDQHRQHGAEPDLDQRRQQERMDAGDIGLHRADEVREPGIAEGEDDQRADNIDQRGLEQVAAEEIGRASCRERV